MAERPGRQQAGAHTAAPRAAVKVEEENAVHHRAACDDTPRIHLPAMPQIIIIWSGMASAHMQSAHSPGMLLCYGMSQACHW
jgi:hypothetical protein